MGERLISRYGRDTNNGGGPTARNTKPSRAARAASAARAGVANCGDVTAAKNSKMKPHGNKNQPDKPNPVISSNATLSQPGSPRAHSTARASRSGMETAATATSASAATITAEDFGSRVNRARRVSARAQSATFSEMLRAIY